MSFKLMVHGWDAEVPTQSHRLVLMKLVDCCDDDGRNIFPKIATVAKAAKCSDRHVQRVIGEFCRIGLLRRVKAGGQGRASAAHYEMDLDLLHLLRRPDTWQALAAAAQYQPLGEDDDHASDACEGDGEQPDSDAAKGDSVSPLNGDRVTPATAKGDKLSHPHITPQESLNSEREGARAQSGLPASEGEADQGHAGNAALPATLDEFRKRWPDIHLSSQRKVEAAWNGLPFAMRREAIDSIAAFIADNGKKGRKYDISAATYLEERRWTLMQAKAEAGSSGGGFETFNGWSKLWWLLLHDRVFSGRDPKFWVERAETGKPLSASAADIGAAAKRVGELKPYLCTGPEIEAWRPWLAAKGARIPPFSGDFRVFLPSETPPAGRREQGDDDVRL